MKIISGSKKSILIKAPKNLPNYTRPTTGKVKESLFNIISNKYNINEIAYINQVKLINGDDEYIFYDNTKLLNSNRLIFEPIFDNLFSRSI